MTDSRTGRGMKCMPMRRKREPQRRALASRVMEKGS